MKAPDRLAFPLEVAFRVIVVGPTLARAMWLAVELETLAKQYFLSLQAGEPVILSDAQVAEATAQFGDYGLREDDADKGVSSAASDGSRSSAAGPRQRRASGRR